ncbi:MAG TPA: hypothetical protein P5307_14805, partial [Pirellulaceae bacterium]|nr:hypothetical protein [Pirellulaceae bacterium]
GLIATARRLARIFDDCVEPTHFVAYRYGRNIRKNRLRVSAPIPSKDSSREPPPHEAPDEQVRVIASFQSRPAILRPTDDRTLNA